MISFIGNRIFICGTEWLDFTPLHRKLLEVMVTVKPGTQINKEDILRYVYGDEGYWDGVDGQRLEQLVSRTNKKLSTLVFGDKYAHKFIQTPAKLNYALIVPDDFDYEIELEDLSLEEKALIHTFRRLGPTERRLLVRSAEAWAGRRLLKGVESAAPGRFPPPQGLPGEGQTLN